MAIRSRRKVEPMGPLTPIDIDAILGKPKNRVDMIGVELEGGWSSKRTDLIGRIDRDGSVFMGPGADNLRTAHPGFHFGEIQVGPFVPAALKRKFNGIWPDMVDITCGMHVHMSFGQEKLLMYNILADSPAYQDTVIYYLTKWAQEEKLSAKHPIWARLAGENKYCRRQFWPTEQSKKTVKEYAVDNYGHRYTIIHYCWRTKTIECRVLPMFEDQAQATRAILRLVDITNAYLAKAGAKKIRESGEVRAQGGMKVVLKMRGGQVYEEYFEG